MNESTLYNLQFVLVTPRKKSITYGVNNESTPNVNKSL